MMRLLVFLFFLLVMNSFCLNNQETFLQANKEYQEKNYEKALTLYSKIKDKGAAIWYNMGNCHYQMGHQADALICWKRAQKGASSSLKKDSKYNIDFLHNGEIKQESSKGFMRVINGMYEILEYGTLFGLQILFLVVWALFWIAIRLSKRGKKYKVASFVLAALIVLLGCIVAFRTLQSIHGEAIVHTDAPLYAGPNEKFHVVGVVHAKDQLAVCAQNDNWYKVAHGKQVGWVNAASVAQL